MSATNAPFGLKPVRHIGGGTLRTDVGTIASAYGTAIYFGSPIAYTTDGTIVAVSAGDTNPILGSFMGCEYTQSDGRRVVSNQWPASTVATDIIAYFTSDPDIEYEMQADGAISQNEIGQQAQISGVTGSTATGRSAATFANATSATTESQLVVVGLAPYPDNAWDDAYTIARVRIRLHQFRAGFDAF